MIHECNTLSIVGRGKVKTFGKTVLPDNDIPLFSPAQGDGEPRHVVVDPDEADEGLGESRVR